MAKARLMLSNKANTLTIFQHAQEPGTPKFSSQKLSIFSFPSCKFKLASSAGHHSSPAMVITLAKSMLIYHPQTTTPPHKSHRNQLTTPIIRASSSSSIDENASTGRRKVISTILTASFGLGLQATPFAMAEAWGTRSFIWERFFQPGLSPEDAVARIKQSAEGLHSIREMLDTQSWRYVIFYIRLKQSYLNQDLKNALSTIPRSRQNEYVDKANEYVDNMAELDSFIRTPRIYESYVYYEKTLQSLDEIVAMLQAS